METIRVRDQGPRARGRLSGQRVREQVSRALKTSGRVQLDFADVESVGATFLGEVLGTLVALHDIRVLDALVFTSCSQGVQASIAQVLRELAPRQGLTHFA